MSLFSKETKAEQNTAIKDFAYLDPKAMYFDSACQTLRPEAVINAEMAYYKEFNACGGRVKYEWGEKVDAKIGSAREKLLKLLKLNNNDYAVAFNLNTTYGLNLVLTQLPAGFERVVTSEIEHNSVFLPTIALSKRLNIERKVLPRTDNGDLVFEHDDLKNAVVVLNVTSNIDGRVLSNVKDIIKSAHEQNGIVVLDVAQTMAHDINLIRGLDFDAACGSAHKMYGPSLGFIVIKKELVMKLSSDFTGGGTVSDVRKDTYDLLEGPDVAARLEPGLQNFAGIVGFEAALDWMSRYEPEGMDMEKHQKEISELAFQKLSAIPSLHFTRQAPSPIISFYSDKIESNRLAIYLSEQDIMSRSGYFCCHYFLREVKNYPPLLRFSLGAYNTREQVEKATDTIAQIIKNV